eukprot:CAMPEP_0117515090 /NCGR_PEP_ID=MMETSP0784-20121206/30401_1 /TAXON_ID=39447 /ORGANISM="" /LENGTH=916 /DNA_ID=CAMNT_0005310897 /DNA_START=36 /DNA_END=2783 /DNA_ORIENTATION=+
MEAVQSPLTDDAHPCPICLDDELADAVVVPCAGQHAFCRECLRTTCRLECPVCRDASEVVAVFLFELSRPETGQLEWMLEQVVAAASTGATRVIDILIGWDCPMGEADAQGWTPLMHAASSGHTATVRRLIDARADPEVFTAEGDNALLLAIDEGYVDVVKYLVEVGVNLKAFSGGDTALHTACAAGHLEIVRFLMESGEDKEATTDEGLTPLHLATMEGRVEVMRYLLEARTDLKAAAEGGYTALLFAAESGIIEVAQCLIEARADIGVVSTGGDLVMHAAAANGHLDMLKYLIECGADKDAWTIGGGTVLHAAVGELGDCNLEVVRYLIELGVGSRENAYMQTPMHMACSSGSLGIVRLLVERGDHVNAVTWDGQTPLHLACARKNPELVDFLVSAKADLELRRSHDCADRASASTNRRGPFLVGQHVFVNTVVSFLNGDVLQPGDAGVVTAVLDGSGEGCDVAQVEAESVRGQTPFRFHARVGQIASASDLTALQLAAMGGCLDIVRLLVSANAELDAGPRTALQQASALGHLDIATFLVGARADLNAFLKPCVVDQKHLPGGWTALSSAAASGHMEVVRFLAEAGADKEIGTQTPLQAASHNGELDVVRYLVEARSSCEAVAEGGRTAMQMAAANGHLEVVRFLSTAGANAEVGPQMLRLAHQRGYTEVVWFLLKTGANLNSLNMLQGLPGQIALSTADPRRMEIIRLLIELQPWHRKVLLMDTPYSILAARACKREREEEGPAQDSASSSGRNKRFCMGGGEASLALGAPAQPAQTPPGPPREEFASRQQSAAETQLSESLRIFNTPSDSAAAFENSQAGHELYHAMQGFVPAPSLPQATSTASDDIEERALKPEGSIAVLTKALTSPETFTRAAMEVVAPSRDVQGAHGVALQKRTVWEPKPNEFVSAYW